MYAIRSYYVSNTKNEEIQFLKSGPFNINLKSRTVQKNDEIIDLTQVEYQIIEFFIKNKNTALDRKSILNQIWGDSYYGDDKIVDVNIRRLRMKIEDDVITSYSIHYTKLYEKRFCMVTIWNLVIFLGTFINSGSLIF